MIDSGAERPRPAKAKQQHVWPGAIFFFLLGANYYVRQTKATKSKPKEGKQDTIVTEQEVELVRTDCWIFRMIHTEDLHAFCSNLSTSIFMQCNQACL